MTEITIKIKLVEPLKGLERQALETTLQDALMSGGFSLAEDIEIVDIKEK